MTLSEKIEMAFGHRGMPDNVLNAPVAITSTQKDAAWFANRNWREITWEDWETHRDAIYAFTPEAFAYYLPSILLFSISKPKDWFWPVDSLIQTLDRSPVVEYWDDFIIHNLTTLRPAEYDVMLAWLQFLSENGSEIDGQVLGRSFDTIVLLKEKAGSFT